MACPMCDRIDNHADLFEKEWQEIIEGYKKLLAEKETRIWELVESLKKEKREKEKALEMLSKSLE